MVFIDIMLLNQSIVISGLLRIATSTSYAVTSQPRMKYWDGHVVKNESLKAMSHCQAGFITIFCFFCIISRGCGAEVSYRMDYTE